MSKVLHEPSYGKTLFFYTGDGMLSRGLCYINICHVLPKLTVIVATLCPTLRDSVSVRACWIGPSARQRTSLRIQHNFGSEAKLLHLFAVSAREIKWRRQDGHVLFPVTWMLLSRYCTVNSRPTGGTRPSEAAHSVNPRWMKYCMGLKGIWERGK
jgi:hypothetical protein